MERLTRFSSHYFLQNLAIIIYETFFIRLRFFSATIETRRFCLSINKILRHVTIYRVYHVVIEEFFYQIFYFGKPLFYEMRVNVSVFLSVTFLQCCGIDNDTGSLPTVALRITCDNVLVHLSGSLAFNKKIFRL